MSDDAPRPGSEIAGVVRGVVKALCFVLLLSVLVALLRLGGFPWTEAIGVALTVVALWWGQSFVFRAIARGRLGGGPAVRRGGAGDPDRPG